MYVARSYVSSYPGPVVANFPKKDFREGSCISSFFLPSLQYAQSAIAVV
jgi:hypothetical protein